MTAILTSLRAQGRMFSVRSPRLHQHDVELIGRIERLALEADRLAGYFFELGDAGRLLVEQPFDHARTREHQQLLEVELSVLAQDLAKDLVADGFRGFHEASAFAAWTRLAEHMFQALPVAL